MEGNNTYVHNQIEIDYITSMIPLGESEYDLLQFCSHENQAQTQPSLEGNQILLSSGGGSDFRNTTEDVRMFKSSSPSAESPRNPNNGKRKSVHRDIEKQRRQEMATLYASLRSELPLEYLKGKRSTADQMEEAAKYIKHLRAKIHNLTKKRDEIKRDINISKCSQSCSQDSVMVRSLSCSKGVEVSINTSFEGGLPLSRVLQVIIDEELNVISCTSTRINERLLHTIECQIAAGRDVDLSKLHQRLTNPKLT